MLSGRSSRLPRSPHEVAVEEPAPGSALESVPLAPRPQASPAGIGIRSLTTVSLGATSGERLPQLRPVISVAAAARTTPLGEADQRSPLPLPSLANARKERRRWLRLAPRVLIPPALLFVVLVPPQSLRATLVTLLIVAVLGIVVWRLPMADDE